MISLNFQIYRNETKSHNSVMVVSSTTGTFGPVDLESITFHTLTSSVPAQTMSNSAYTSTTEWLSFSPHHQLQFLMAEWHVKHDMSFCDVMTHLSFVTNIQDWTWHNKNILFTSDILFALFFFLFCSKTVVSLINKLLY